METEKQIIHQLSTGSELENRLSFMEYRRVRRQRVEEFYGDATFGFSPEIGMALSCCKIKNLQGEPQNPQRL
jgi:hypothetical protein